jgi:F-type H+-transporting ATPase subunit gamma
MSDSDAVRRRLEGAETLATVVTTMKTLASVRIGQYRRAVAALDASSKTLDLAAQALVRLYPELLATTAAPEARSLAVVVFGSDRGLCGPFNDRLARAAQAALVEGRAADARPEEVPLVLAIGRRLAGRLRVLGVPVERQVRPPGALDTVDMAVLDVLTHVDAWRSAARADRLVLVHARPTSAAAFTTRTVRLLPLDVAWLRRLRDRPWPTNRMPLELSDPPRLLHGVIRQRIAHALVGAFAASQAAENAARLAAMDAAERNIQERVAQLHSAYHQARQNAITEELLDIQAAYAAAGGDGRG